MSGYIIQPPGSPSVERDSSDQGSSNFKGKRGLRACDRCRKIKSKCQLGENDDKCKACIATGTSCTFQGPSFKRGPPKGYIKAIEQRWHQVECILGVIMSSPRAQSIIEDLRRNEVAQAILDQVDHGPYGPAGRPNQMGGGSQEEFYAAIMNDAQLSDRRSHRQSRVSRENVSRQDNLVLSLPTQEWQNKLALLLNSPQAEQHQSTSPRNSNSDLTARDRVETTSPSSWDDSGKRRRLLDSPLPAKYTVNPESPNMEGLLDIDTTIDSFGHLSLGDNEEIRYHGNASGFQLLAKSDRTDDSQSRVGGIWNFKSKTPSISSHTRQTEVEENIMMPNEQTQDYLVSLYFTYVHPTFPVLHRGQFLEDYSALKSGFPSHRPASSSGRHPMQNLTKLLLLSMFTIAAQYAAPSSRAGEEYSEEAHRILRLLEEGWLDIGMALRMAIDLGMNHNADQWKDNEGNDIFTPTEKQIRKQIWYSCCISDKLSSVLLGRPPTFRANDFSTERPEILPSEEETWQSPTINVPPPAGILMCFRESCTLSFIMSEIMGQVYSVEPQLQTYRETCLNTLEQRLRHWFLDLPIPLKVNVSKGVNISEMDDVPPPHVLVLHIEYQSAVVLLYRAFLPCWEDARAGSPQDARDSSGSVAWRSFDLASSAAAQMSSLVTIYKEKHGLTYAPASLSMYMQTAGIMHVITLCLRPYNASATVGLRQCLDALREMEITWPSAMFLRNLLKGCNVQVDEVANWSEVTTRPKRTMPEDDANEVGRYQNAEESSVPATSVWSPDWQNDENVRRNIAQTLLEQSGLADPYQGHWWPRTGSFEGFQQQQYQQTGLWPDILESSEQTALAPQGDFTFGENQISSQFLQNLDGSVPGYSQFIHPTQM